MYDLMEEISTLRCNHSSNKSLLTCASTDIQQRKKFMSNIHESNFIVPLSAAISSSVTTTLYVHLNSNVSMLYINIAFIHGDRHSVTYLESFHRHLSKRMQQSALSDSTWLPPIHADPHREESVTVSYSRAEALKIAVM